MLRYFVFFTILHKSTISIVQYVHKPCRQRKEVRNMALTEPMEFLKEYWPILFTLAGIVWHLITQYFSFQRTKEKLQSFEKSTTDWLNTYENRHQEKFNALEDQVANHRKELGQAIELAKEKAEKDMLKSKDETAQRMEKLFDELRQSNSTLTELKTGFIYIKEAIDDLKKR